MRLGISIILNGWQTSRAGDTNKHVNGLGSQTMELIQYAVNRKNMLCDTWKLSVPLFLESCYYCAYYKKFVVQFFSWIIGYRDVRAKYIFLYESFAFMFNIGAIGLRHWSVSVKAF